MRIETEHLILLFILLLCPLVYSDLRAQEKTPVTRADSIMRQVIHQAPIYEHVLESYEAETYVKGRTHVPRKNKLLRYAYLVFPVERHPCDALFEMSGLTRFIALEDVLVDGGLMDYLPHDGVGSCDGCLLLCPQV